MEAKSSALSGACFETTRPDLNSTSSGRALYNGDLESAIACAISFSLACSAAAFTAGSTLAVDIEPAEIGASGRLVIPNRASTIEGGTPSTAAATSVITVWLPVSISCVPEPAKTRPFDSRRTTADAATPGKSCRRSPLQPAHRP